MAMDRLWMMVNLYKYQCSFASRADLEALGYTLRADTARTALPLPGYIINWAFDNVAHECRVVVYLV